MRSRDSGCCALAAQWRWIFRLYDACGREVLTGTTSPDPPAVACSEAVAYTASGDVSARGHGFSAANPLRFTDPSGLMVIADERCQDLIRKGLSMAEGIYVEFNDDGVLNADLLNQADVLSNNLAALKKLSNSDMNYNFHSASSFSTLEKGSIVKKELKADRNDGTTGVTSVPNGLEDPSLDNEVHIYISNHTPEETQVQTLAHEGYGHGYLYELSRQGYNVNPFHDREQISYFEYDPASELNFFTIESYETNIPLLRQIRKSVQQARTNYNIYWK